MIPWPVAAERLVRRLLRLTAVGDGLHFAAANAHDRQVFARAAFVQPLFGVQAGYGKGSRYGSGTMLKEPP